MDLLITVIGNAAVDPNFRKRFLDNPVDTIDHYGIHLTKGDFELMQTVFGNLGEERDEMERGFLALEKLLYAKLPCPQKPCLWSIFPPPEFRAEYRKTA